MDGKLHREELVEVRAALHGLDEDDHLVEHERVEEVVELAVLLRLGQLDVVLDEAVEGELGLVVDEISIGSFMNFLHTGRISLDSVAENIITCLSCGSS